MTRSKGIYKFPVNFELESAAPLDAKTLCSAVSGLTALSTWQTVGDTGNANVYKGMAVSVYDDPVPSNNTVWVLTVSGNGYQNINNWKSVTRTDFISNNYLPLTGGTITGTLNVDQIIALTSTTFYQNISVTELSGFTVLGTLTSLDLPNSVQEGNNLVWLNGVGISATNFAVFDGDSAIRKLYITPRHQNPSIQEFYPTYRSQFLDGYLISSSGSCDYGYINLNLGADNSRNLTNSNLYQKQVSGVNLYFGVGSDVKTVKFNSRNWNGFGNPNYPWRPVGITVPSALSSSDVLNGLNYGLGYTIMLMDGETGNVGIGIPGVFDPDTNPNIDGKCFGGGPGEGKPNHRLTVYGNISATGTIFGSNFTGGAGSTDNWNSVYATVCANSSLWDGNFCNETVYMANLSGCWNNSLSTSLISISGNLNLNGYSISGVNNGVFNSSVLSRLITAQEIVVSGFYINSLDPNKKGHYQWNPEGSNSWNSEFTNRILVRKDSNLDGYDLATPGITIYNAITGENKTVQLAFAGQGYDLSESTYPVSIGGIIAKTGEQDTSYGFTNGSLNLYTVDKFGDRKDALIIDHTGQATFNYKISAPCGNSDQWCESHTSVVTNSAMWGTSFSVSNGVGISSINITVPQNYTNAFFNIGVVSGTNIRSSQMMVAWNGSNVVFTENSTTDLGNTSAVSLSAGYSGSNIIIQSIINSGTWTIKGSKSLM